MERRRDLVLYLIENNGKPHSKFWLDLAIEFNIGEGLPGERRADRARKYWQWYSNNGRYPDMLVPEDTASVPDKEALDKSKTLSKRKPDHPYDGLMLRSAWEAQTPEGIVTLHSYRNNITGEDLENFQNDFVEKIKNAIQSDRSLIPVVDRPSADNENGLFVYTADKHIGATTPAQSLYDNKYGPEIVYERTELLLNSLLQEADRFGVFDSLYYVDLGDALDGRDGITTRGTKLDQSLDNYDQYDLYFQVHKEFFDAVVKAGIAEDIVFIGMSNANHDGLGFGYSAMRAVEIYLNAAYPNISTAISRQLIDHLSYGKHNFMFAHGKDEQYMGKALPKVLDPRAEQYITNYMDYHRLGGVGPVEEDRKFNHFIKGDLHQSSTEYAKRFRYRNVSSFYGASAYISANFGFNFPAVDYEIVEKNTSKIYETRLFL